jgi:hypothetical protein
MNISSVFKKILCVFLSFLVVFSQLAYATPGKNIIKTSKEIKQEYDKKNIVFTKKAKNGVKVKIIENPKEKEAGVFLIDDAIIIGVIIGGIIVSGEMIRQNNARRRGEKYEPNYTKAIVNGVGAAVSEKLGETGKDMTSAEKGVRKGLSTITDVAVDSYDSYEENKGDVNTVEVVGKNLISAGIYIISEPLETLVNVGETAGEYIPDVIESLKYTSKDLNELNNYVKDYIRDSGFSPYGLLMWDSLTHNYGGMNEDFRLILNNNPIESSPQTVTFSETFSGYCSAVADYPGANSSNITFSNLEGKRNGVLPFNLIQTMSGRFQGYEGVYANTFYDASINGEISGESVYMHNRPVVAQAQLILSGILDFKSAVGPFTINPDGTSFGTFKGHTFDFFDPNRATGDVTLYYRASPVGFGGGGGGGGAR